VGLMEVFHENVLVLFLRIVYKVDEIYIGISK
jgi:hypothetical protein